MSAIECIAVAGGALVTGSFWCLLVVFLSQQSRRRQRR